MLKLQGFRLTRISPKDRCWSPPGLCASNTQGKFWGCRELVSTCIAVVCREAWAKLTGFSWRPRVAVLSWHKSLNLSNIKQKCAFQTPATSLWGWLCGMTLVHFCCSLPCVTVLSSFTLIIYNHKMKSQDRRKMSWFWQTASATGIVCNFRHMLNCFAGLGSNFLGRYCKTFWEDSWKEETKTFPL